MGPSPVSSLLLAFACFSAFRELLGVRQSKQCRAEQKKKVSWLMVFYYPALKNHMPVLKPMKSKVCECFTLLCMAYRKLKQDIPSLSPLEFWGWSLQPSESRGYPCPRTIPRRSMRSRWSQVTENVCWSWCWPGHWFVRYWLQMGREVGDHLAQAFYNRRVNDITKGSFIIYNLFNDIDTGWSTNTCCGFKTIATLKVVHTTAH